MKKRLLTIAVLLFSAACFAQPKKAAALPAPAATKATTPKLASATNTAAAAPELPGKKTVTYEYIERQDTSKVRLVCYGADNAMVWLNAYVVKSLGIFGGGQQPVELKPAVFFTDDWKPINQKDILSGNAFQW